MNVYLNYKMQTVLRIKLILFQIKFVSLLSFKLKKKFLSSAKVSALNKNKIRTLYCLKSQKYKNILWQNLPRNT